MTKIKEMQLGSLLENIINNMPIHESINLSRFESLNYKHWITFKGYFMGSNLTYKLNSTSALKDLHLYNSLREHNTHRESTNNITSNISNNHSNSNRTDAIC